MCHSHPQLLMYMEQPPYTEEDPSTITNSPTTQKPGPESCGASRHPFYRGVRKRRWGKWVSEIREPRKKSRIWLGSFPMPEMAAKAYDVAAYCLKGRKAQLNFPEDVEHLPRPPTCTARDIQAAAAKAAKTIMNSSSPSITKQNNDLHHDDGLDGVDDFWDEIELPELVNCGGCHWTSSSSSGGWNSMTTFSGEGEDRFL